MDDYRVNLEMYNGPLDLLLFLIRRDEVDIYDIPIARITEQYVSYVDVLQELDPNWAGEFLVMAATLMEIKTRLLLPVPPPEDDDEDALGDPRTELVRQLLEYKAFKDAANDLREAADTQSLKFPRRPEKLSGADDEAVELDNVQIWDLFDAFGKVLESIGHRAGKHEVIYDDTPVELHEADILDRLQREGGMSFARIFEGRNVRSQIVGLFLALLELIRQQKLQFRQDANFGEIWVEVKPEVPDGAEPPEKADSYMSDYVPRPKPPPPWKKDNPDEGDPTPDAEAEPAASTDEQQPDPTESDDEP
jgi:segregation and condensation protein A